MISRHVSRPTALCLLIAAASCGQALDGDPAPVRLTARAGGQAITYVGKQSTTDFTGYGQHLQYWPLFGRTSPQTARRTDDADCIEITPAFSDFKHHYLPEGRTFSNDALGSPIGTKTRGGYANWPMFTLPDGSVGRSGTFYDESNIDNSNNTINQMKINVSSLHEFCLNLITDNTAGEHDPDVRLEARSDDVDVSLEGHPDLTFDGQTDMYTFRYEGMQEDDLVKVRFQCSSSSGCQGAGLGGVMISDISTCTANAGSDAGAGEEDAGAPDAGVSDPGTPDGGGNGEADPTGAGCGCQSGRTRGSGEFVVVLLLAAVARRVRARR